MKQLVVVPPTEIGVVNLAVHGHFYQPERSDPFTGMIPIEAGAAPYPNYNEKITAECYRPNAELGNFDRISFDMGPTLAAYLERAHPDVYARIIQADRRHRERYGCGNAIAQPYNHTILPLSNRRDKVTQIRWGLSDFRHRFGRDATGMWCPETAVDVETLDVLAQEGITYTILAPWQITTPVDTTEAYYVSLHAGRRMAVFVYNDLSGAVSYDDAQTHDANDFAKSFMQSYRNTHKDEQIHLVCSDGELYGHHKPGRERFLDHLLRCSARAFGFEVCTLERFLQAFPPRSEVEIRQPSSWSCSHGVSRWHDGCSCTEGDSSWKRVLRWALGNLREQCDLVFEQHAGEWLHDHWDARDDYLALREGWIAPEQFWARHSKCGTGASVATVQMVRHLLEAQYWLQCSQTSCGWFFEDLDRIEPRNNIAFARAAISHMFQAVGVDLQRNFVKDLALAQSWRTGVTGADVYASLAALPKMLLPPLQER